MKRFRVIALVLSVILVFSGCSNRQDSSINSQLLPEQIENVKVSGNYNGELEPWELDAAEIEALETWVSQLSLEHKSYKEGEAPNERLAGGVSFAFSVNEETSSFVYSNIDAAYIWFNGEWYEIKNPSDPPIKINTVYK